MRIPNEGQSPINYPDIVGRLIVLPFVKRPVVGEKESESGTVNVRSRGGKQLGRRTTQEALTSLRQLRDARSNLEEF